MSHPAGNAHNGGPPPLEELLLDGQGRWSYGGRLVENKRVQALFHASLFPDGSGGFELRLGGQVAPVRVAGPPVFVERLFPPEQGGLFPVRCACGRQFHLDPATLVYHEGSGQFTALRHEDGQAMGFLRTGHHDLSTYLVEGDDGRVMLAGVGGALTALTREPS